MPWIVIIIYRLIVPLTILKWPFWGSLLAIVGDNMDVVVADAMGVTDYTLYNPIDKIMDTYMYLLMGVVAWRWKGKGAFARKLVLGLLAYRMVGVLIYEVLIFAFPNYDSRWLLFVFPNLFVFVFLYVEGYRTFTKRFPFTNFREAAPALIILLLLKLAQEYMLHVAQFPIYNLIKSTIFQPLGIPL